MRSQKAIPIFVDDCSRIVQIRGTFFLFFQFPDLLEKTYKASSVLVPNHGWHIFGGAHAKELTKAQKLVNLESGWEEGPELYNGGDMSGLCSVQVI